MVLQLPHDPQLFIGLRKNQEEEQMATKITTVVDTDGIPPGMDTALTGRQGMVKFSGHFFAEPEKPYVEFERPVTILIATKEVYVAMDIELHNLYVVDRAKNLSLGCRMHAEFSPGKGRA